MTFLIFQAQSFLGNFQGEKNALISQLIDSDDRALHKDSESGPNSKITKITNMTFLQNPAEVWQPNKLRLLQSVTTPAGMKFGLVSPPVGANGGLSPSLWSTSSPQSWSTTSTRLFSSMPMSSGVRAQGSRLTTISNPSSATWGESYHHEINHC